MIRAVVDQKDIDHINKMLTNIGQNAPRVISRALNKTAVSARVRLKNRAQAAYTVKSGKFNKNMNIKKASYGYLCAEIRSEGSPLSIDNFKVSKGKRNIRAQIVAGGGLKTLKKGNISAFVGVTKNETAKDLNGKIYQRVGKSRYSIKKLSSNSIPVMIGSEERVYGVEKDNIQSDLNKYVSQQIAILIK